MTRRWIPPLVVVLLGGLVLLGAAPPAEAQQAFESTGTRALGMAGAFVAVANDATAVYWNPAGLATAGPVGMTIGWTRLRSGNQKAPPVPGATGETSTFTSLGSMPLGLFYGSAKRTTLVAGAGGGTDLETLQTSQFGATILQSLARGVVLGSSLKYVRGGVTTGQSTGLSARAWTCRRRRPAPSTWTSV